jgi:DNA-binding MurR/RpiR family transcriptional regulator
MAKNEAKSLNVEARIRAAFDSMSAGQQKVAEFVLTRGAEAAYLPAAQIADLVSVSHSTVIRMAQALGYEGFPEFQAALQERLLGQISSADRFRLASRLIAGELAEEQGGERASVLHQVMLADAIHVETVARQIPVADFEQAIDLLDNARRVYVVGLSYISAYLALNFGAVLSHIRSECHVLQSGIRDLPDQLMDISEDDLLVAISFTRYVRDTLRCMDYAKEIGASVLAITDSPLSPAAKRADVALVVPDYRQPSVVAARLSLTNALVVGVAMRHHDATQRRLEHLDGIHQHFQFFEE